MNLSDLKMVNLLSWVFEKGPEIFYEMLVLFSTMPTAKLSVVPKNITKVRTESITSIAIQLESQRDDEVSKPHSLEKLNVYYMSTAEV